MSEAQRDGRSPTDEDPGTLADLVLGSFVRTCRRHDRGPDGLDRAYGRFAVRPVSRARPIDGRRGS